MKSLGWIGATTGSLVAGSVGWWLGALIGSTTAFIISGIMGGVGMYYGRKWALRMVGM
ncbi:MAG: hypothetical protein ACREL4_06015 [Gemmatimonadales bacterium]